MSIKQYIPHSVKQFIKGAIVDAVKSPPVRAFYCNKARQMAEKSKQSIRLHLGCGPRHLEGWINIDLFPTALKPDVLIDVQRPLPLRSASVDYIFTEDLIEHLTYDGARDLLSECARVLKPGGKLRVGTPDLQLFIQAYLKRSQRDLDWYGEHCGVKTFAEMFNYGMRAWGHTFIYDEETLTNILIARGFTVERKEFNQTDADAFIGLDLRSTEDGAHSLFLECTKQAVGANTKQKSVLTANAAG